MDIAPLASGCDARLRGETVKVAHVQRVPRHRDLFGSMHRAHWRATCVWPDGRWSNNVNLHELAPVSGPD